ncbi:hypothetical protein RD792_015983 [Penstemon davidsonii]|uniref:Cyclin N-terminal domain-containing protein n=1 Tax=Penstemon davidsonii TaxID=160366 RepID=A0ABR0CI45_9LAMI|nr:hypothetical protein RD792_015983 [Penstemon davidsonii]
MKKEKCSCVRSRVVEFLMQSAQRLEVSPIVKYSALSLFADRFYPALSRFEDGKGTISWLLHPIRESNLQLFALVSIWISSKIHDTPPLSVKNLKLLGDKFIKEQHYATRDHLEAEMVLMQVIMFIKVLEFGIGMSNIAFVLVEELLGQLKVVARVGEHVAFEACMDIMDLLYEKEVTPVLYGSPCFKAASILVDLLTCNQAAIYFPLGPSSERVFFPLQVAAYVITVPKQRWEFPVLPWVQFVTPCKEEDILDSVKQILKHIFDPQPD